MHEGKSIRSVVVYWYWRGGLPFSVRRGRCVAQLRRVFPRCELRQCGSAIAVGLQKAA